MNRKFILFTVICILFLFSSMINAEKTFYTNLITDADCTDNNQWIRSGFDVGSASGYGLINAVSPYDSENGDEALIVNYSFTSRSFYLYRDIDISEYAGLVDLGVITVDASAYIFRPNTNYYYFDLFYRVSYFDENDQLIGTEQKPTFSGWRLYNVNSDILAGTRKIRVEVYGDGNGSMVCAAVDGVETQLQLNTDKAVPVIYNGDKDQIVNSKGSIEISGYVYDKNNDDVIISASIDGQEASDRVTGGNGPWTFSWDANIIANGSYSNIQVSADDNNDGGYTDIYTGNIIIDNIVPDLLTVTMSSNNTYTGRARGGDKIILDIISSEDILEPEIIISGQTASVTDTGDSDATTCRRK